jgi:UDP-glucose 4-epimerase
MSQPLLWVIGSGGHLGSRMAGALSQELPNSRLWTDAPRHFSWTQPSRLVEELTDAVRRFAADVRRNAVTWGVLWCAGAGTIRSSAVALEPERLAWEQLLDLLGRYLAQGTDRVPGLVFLASSAGGVFGGSAAEYLSEHSPAVPVTAYGNHKFRMEQTLQRWTEAVTDVRSLAGRISTLYGPGQNLQKTQGIISHLSHCLIWRQPANIYVSLDTRRDYLFVDDCAHNVAVSIRRLLTQGAGMTTKIFASEELTSLGRIAGIFFRLSRHRPFMIFQRHHDSQAISLKFRSEVWRDLQARKTDLAVGIHLVHEYQLAQYRRGLLAMPASH